MTQLTIALPGGSDIYGTDTMYVHGADIVDPENNRNVIVDQSVEPVERVYVVTIEASEDEQPYRDALTELGITVTGTDADGNWTGEQTYPLPL